MTGVKKVTVKILSEEVEKLKEQLNKDVTELKQKVNDLETILETYIIDKGKKEILSLNEFDCKKCDKSFDSAKNLKMHISNIHPSTIECKSCGKKFAKSSDFEMHMISQHQETKKYKCEQCEKSFILEWRLKKHTIIHSTQNIKYCHFFNNEEICLYDEIGCMYKHEVSPKCFFQDKCRRKLCQYKHDLPQAVLKSEECDFFAATKNKLEEHILKHTLNHTNPDNESRNTKPNEEGYAENYSNLENNDGENDSDTETNSDENEEEDGEFKCENCDKSLNLCQR